MMYDLAIIGGGPAGYSAAFEAASFNMSVVLFEKDKVGGTCLNRGCVPTSFYENIAHFLDQKNRLASQGIYASDNGMVNLQAAYEKKQMIVNDLRSGLLDRFSAEGVEVIHSAAKVISPGSIQSEGEDYHAKYILIAAGAKNRRPVIENCIFSDDVLELKEIPRTIKVIGGGVVAVELADAFQSFGSKVEICIRGDRILRKFDKDLAVAVTQHLKQKGVVIKPKCTENDYKADPPDITLSAVGRVPALDELIDASLAIEVQEGIVVDAVGRTNVEGIYAAGDVVQDSVQLAHTAMEQGRICVRDMAGLKEQRSSVVSECIYINPEMATTGYTVKEAEAAGIQTVSAKYPMQANASTVIGAGERGFIKLVADADRGILVGAQLMCEHASDMISEISLAVNEKIPVKEFAENVRPHPSFSEAVTEAAVLLMEKIKAVHD